MKLSSSQKTILLSVVCVLLMLILFTLPLLSYTTTLFSKKSNKTVIGDEKYVALRAEAEAAAEEYRKAGLNVDIIDSVSTRTNSKGEVTSMVTVTVAEKKTLTVWTVLSGGLTGSTLLKLMLCSAVLAVIMMAAGSCLNLQRSASDPAKARQRVLGLAVAFALTALLLVPITIMSLNVTLTRQTGLYAAGMLNTDFSATLKQLDALLYNGTAGDRITEMVSSLSVSFSALWWMTLIPAFTLICCTLYFWKGSVVKGLARGLLYAFVITLCLVILYPYYVMLITGFRSLAETNDMYFLHVFPTEWIWSNLTDIMDRGVLQYLGNSVLLSVGATTIALLCGIPAAYAMSRFSYKGKNAFLGFVIMSQMFAPVVLLVGISALMNALHLNDSLIGLMLINAAFNQAFAIWLLRGTFVAISPEMEQAATIDGCSNFTAMLRILLPMAAPGIVTTLIFVFINAWNEYTISTVLISTTAKRPITVGVTQFSSFNMIEWQYLFAAALIATIPVVILFMCIEKHLAEGLTAGGVKG